MKSLLLFLLLLRLSPLYAQMDSEGLISTNGTTLEGQEMLIDYTTGVWTALNMQNSNGQITGGILQPTYQITSITDTESAIQINVYPNPTAGIININIEEEEILSDLFLTLIDPQGKLVLTQKLSQSLSINLENLQPQNYFLNISSEKKGHIRQFKILRIN